MRKHFLILMLMALLPLAALATPFSQNARLVVGEITYGDNTAPRMVVIDEAEIAAAYWEWDQKFYTDANCTQLAGKTVEETFTAYTISTVPAGRYFVKVSGKNPFTGTLKNQIIVKKRPITLSLGDENFHKVYGDPDPVLDENATLEEVIEEGASSQFVNGDDVSSILGDFTLAGAKITYEGTDANKTASGGDFAIAVPGYDIQIVGLAEAVENYDITFSQKMDIWQKAFTGDEEDFSVTLAKKTAVYNGDPQAPKYVVKLGDLTVTYDVQFFSNAERTNTVAANAVINAGKYYTKIVGNGNFSGTYFDEEETFSEETAAAGYDFIWQITKRPLTIKALDQEKVYDATTTVPENAENKGYSIMGRAKADHTFGTITLTASNANAGARKIIPSGATNANYEFNYVEGNLTIKPAKLYITAEKAEKVYGKEDPKFKFHVEGIVGATYKYTQTAENGTQTVVTKTVGPDFTFDPTAEGWNLTYKSLETTPQTSTTPLSELDNILDVRTTKETNNTAGRIKVTRNNTTENDRKLYKGVLVPSWNTNAAVFENYEITPVNGDFDITGGTIIVTALNQSKTYGDADPSWTANENVNYIVSGLAGDDKLSKKPTLTRAEGEDYAVDGYDITISGAEAPDGYTGIIYVNGTFMINKAELHVKALDQKVTLAEGASAETALAALNPNAFTIDATKKLKNGDAAEDVFEIKLATAAVAAQSIVVPTYEHAGTYKSIIVALTDEDVAKNYELTFTPGNLVIAGNGELIFDRNDQNLVDAFAAANPEENYDVKFLNNRTLRAGQWNMMVLPFDVTVPQLSAAMVPNATEEEPHPVGYAIVNVLNSATTSSDVRFELYMGKIVAHTPFLIKTAADVDLNTITAANVKIVAPTGDEVTGPTYNDVVFKGIYATKANLEAGEMTIKTDKKYYGARTGANLRPFEAYLTGVTAGARIFIEDIDENGTTAIKELNVDTMKAYAVDGWYTLNGVKLQAAPTEKGVYINNGKKVVIK